MKPRAARACLAVFALCLFDATQARADFVDWNYSWSPSAPVISADNPSMGQIKVLPETAGSANGYSSIVAANLQTISNADPKNPAVFTNTPYGLTLSIADGPSGKTGTLTFGGEMSGVLSSANALVSNKFTGAVLQSMQIGDNVYTVNLSAFAPPGPPTSNVLGSIGALVGVTPAEAPEPSTLALAGLGLSLLGMRWWRRKVTR
ncbi:MAG TPA: PEP-CTERM sorting domain-containing protein [Gemmataceae bacterium]|nr:PEP-CTERM sorting domain-containing protein [Gemmataceae bacterium]